jgi:hypothetical protein
MPFLPHFSKFLICWTSYEARKEAQRHFPSTIPEGMENVTLIVDATPYQFNIVEMTPKKEKKEYGMEHIKCGVCFFFISNPRR